MNIEHYEGGSVTRLSDKEMKFDKLGRLELEVLGLSGEEKDQVQNEIDKLRGELKAMGVEFEEQEAA
ncbi:MAG: hypothetical protein NTZ44_00100 [Candidatus Nomurabacteria bacterium]|nr:hypothetical protein [Candidatus Nomurabacteria bacterium]